MAEGIEWGSGHSAGTTYRQSDSTRVVPSCRNLAKGTLRHASDVGITSGFQTACTVDRQLQQLVYHLPSSCRMISR